MVPRKAGWDTHGLPVELEVEKLLGLDGKEQIEEYGLTTHLSKNVKSLYGNTKACGKISPERLVSGLIWITHMLLMTITLSNPSGGH